VNELLNITATVVASPRSLWKAMRLLPRSMWLPYMGITVLIAGAFALNYWSIEAVRSQGDGVASLIDIARGLGALRASLVDAETAERGFLLTRDEQFLEPYKRAQQNIPGIFAQLGAAVAHDRELSQVVDELRGIEQMDFGFIDRSVEAARKGSDKPAVTLLRNASGKELMDEYRRATDDALARVDGRLAVAYRAQADNIRYSRLAALLVDLLAIGLLALVLRLLLARAARDASQLQELETAVAVRTEELFELSRHLQLMQERERADLARNLHDELGGLMTAAKMDLASVQEFPLAADPQIRDKLGEIAKILESAMQIKRRVVEGLRPALLDHFGPAAAISTYVEENGQRAGLAVSSRIDADFDSVDQDVALSVFRLVQEALTNCIRHASASRFAVTLEVQGNWHVMTIEDDGVGLGRGHRRGSHGIVGMNHRVRVLGGTITFVRAAQGGVRIDIRIPRQAPSAEPGRSAAPQAPPQAGSWPESRLAGR
jgi:signal transduction histidine kinase